MANANTSAAVPSSYEQLATRVSRIINSTGAQKSRSAALLMQPGDNPDDWAQLIGEISENDNVTVAHRDDGYQIFWTVQKED